MRVLKIVALIVVAASVSACNGEKLSCSSPSVQKLVSQVELDSIRKNLFAAAYIDIDKTTIRLDSFRTRKEQGNISLCAATIYYDVAYKPGTQDTLEGKQYAQLFTGNLVKSGKDLIYTVEMMDDGEQFSVEVHN